jgi:hypothetical protein
MSVQFGKTARKKQAEIGNRSLLSREKGGDRLLLFRRQALETGLSVQDPPPPRLECFGSLLRNTFLPPPWERLATTRPADLGLLERRRKTMQVDFVVYREATIV